MDLVVGASESTVKSLLVKLGSLLAQEYTLIRGVGRDLQFITDELRTMQSFLRDLGDAEQDHRMKDWMKQIRDMTYDVEDCVDDSGHRIHNPRWLRTNMCCYFVLSTIYEVLTWAPRRDIAAKISDLKMRAQEISERRQRYGVENPKSTQSSSAGGGAAASNSTGFSAADNQDRSLKLVAMDPVRVHTNMEDLNKKMGMEAAEKISTIVLAIVGFGGVGKTIMATELYRKFGDQFDCRAMVTVSQGSDLEAILTSIKDQVMPQSDDQKQKGSSPEKRTLGVAFRGIANQVRLGTSAVMSKCRCSVSGIPDNNNDQAKLESDSGHKEQQETSEHDSEEEEEEEQGSLVGKKSLTAAVRGTLGQVTRCTSALVDKCSVSSTSKKTQDNARLIQLKEDLKIVLTKNRYATPNLSALCFIASVHIARHPLPVLT